MQIFVTSKCPKESAETLWLNPLRARKMITETQQILACCEQHFYGKVFLKKVDGTPYSTPKSRMNHPVVKWAREDIKNASWVLRHLIYLYSKYEGEAFKNVAENIYKNCNIPKDNLDPVEFCNFAKSDEKGLDFRWESNTFKAYQLFLNIQK